VDLEVSRAEILAVVGVSGSGKSTLLHLLGALDTPTSGTVWFQGIELSSSSSRDRTLYRRRAVGFVFQSFHLIPSLTAEGNVALALTFQGTYGRQRRRLALEALERVGLQERAAHRPAQLSGGEQQRVAIARAMVHRPSLVLADEPTGNLDHLTSADILGLLSDARSRLGTTVVVVTHDEEAARKIADRVVRLRDGRPWSGGAPE
jgi:putative ABC transport system ATP-binding protein